MKTQALVMAALLACGTTAFAQNDRPVHRADDKDRVEQHDQGSAGEKMRNGMHRLGEKVRSGMHRLGEKLHAHNDRHTDTHAMGASRGDDRTADNAERRQRMDDAYANYRAKHDRDTTNR
jgi:Skp family chaperone for outer membrane proteins